MESLTEVERRKLRELLLAAKATRKVRLLQVDENCVVLGTRTTTVCYPRERWLDLLEAHLRRKMLA